MAVPAPGEFIATAQERGFLFSVEPGGRIGVTPPAPGAITEAFRRYVRMRKPEILALLRPLADGDLLTSKDTPLVSVPKTDDEEFAARISWAVSMAKAGRFPKPSEPLIIRLPGSLTVVHDPAQWLLEGIVRAERLREMPYPDCVAAYEVLCRQLVEIAKWGETRAA
jgi:hypothetical protein